MKKYIFYIAGLILINILVTLYISTSLASVQQDYLQLRQTELNLQEENTRLSREVALLSSLKRISQAAENLGLTETNNRVVYVREAALAALK